MYNPILTNIGKAKIADAIANNTTVNLTQMAFGNGGGASYVPDESQTELVNEVYRITINSLITNPSTPTLIEALGIIPSDVGGFTVREVAIFDEDGDMIAISDFPPFDKIIMGAAATPLEITFLMKVTNSENVVLTIDDSVVYASKKYVDETLELYITKEDGVTKEEFEEALVNQTIINKPSIISPADGIVDYVGSFESSPMVASSSYKGTLDYVHWQLASDEDFTNIVDEKNDSISLIFTPNNTQPSTKYYVRVKHGSDNHLSAWSDAINFTTPASSIKTPSITSPANNSVNFSQKVTLIADAYVPFGQSESHLSSTWEIATDINFTNIIDASEDDTVNLTSWISGDLPLDATYYARVKYKSASYSSIYSTVIAFSIPNTSISTPSITSPANNSINMSETVTITASPYEVFGHTEPHLSSTWQVATDINFLNIVSQSINDTVNLTSWTSGTLPLDATYYIRVKYKSATYSSDNSNIVTFKIPAGSINTPSITAPINNAVDVGKNVTLTSDPYSAFGHSEPHLSSTWQISTDQYFTNIVTESINDTTKLTSWTSGNLTESTIYYARVQYKSANFTSDFSSTVKFTTKAQFTISAGIAGTKGFSVAPTTEPFALLGLAEMAGTNDPTSDNYGNYIHTNGSIVCWLPKTYYRVGHPDSPRYAKYGANALDFEGTDVFTTQAEANAAGYVLPRVFINAGKEQPGAFVDKYMNSKDGNTASKSVFGGVPISLTTQAGYTVSNGMTGCTGILADAVVLSKARGERWNAATAFIYAYLAMVSVAQAQAATSTADVAWYDPTGLKNFPKGCNNNALSDVDDTTVVYASAGDSGNANKPKTGATANFAKTTHNGSNNGVADLNGGMFEVTIGITNFGSSATATTAIANDTIYVLKQSIDVATLTGGWNGTNDVWGNAANLGTKYDVISSPHPLGSSNGVVYWGNGSNAVFQNDLNGINRDVCGFIPKNSSSTSASGANLFGNDYFYKYNVQNMVPLACGHWDTSANAGVFYRYFNNNRSRSANSCGFRASAYFA